MNTHQLLDPGHQRSHEASTALPPAHACWRCQTRRAGNGPSGLCTSCVSMLATDEDHAALHAIAEGLVRQGIDSVVVGDELHVTSPGGQVVVTVAQAHMVASAASAVATAFGGAALAMRAHLATVGRSINERLGGDR